MHEIITLWFWSLVSSPPSQPPAAPFLLLGPCSLGRFSNQPCFCLTLETSPNLDRWLLRSHTVPPFFTESNKRNLYFPWTVANKQSHVREREKSHLVWSSSAKASTPAATLSAAPEPCTALPSSAPFVVLVPSREMLCVSAVSAALRAGGNWQMVALKYFQKREKTRASQPTASPLLRLHRPQRVLEGTRGNKWSK